jgi:hypothetical protein
MARARQLPLDPHVIVDGPDFQALSPGAKLVWYTLKMTLGPSGIDVVPALVGTLMERTGLDEKGREGARAARDGGLDPKRERNVVWMVDGLRHDPHFSLTTRTTASRSPRTSTASLGSRSSTRSARTTALAPTRRDAPSTPGSNGLRDGIGDGI